MIGEFPQNIIKQKDLHNWTQYSQHIPELPFIKKYLEFLIKHWVDNCNNPLAIYWVSRLLEDKLDYMEDRLKKLEETIGENDLIIIFDELLSLKTEYPDEVEKKIDSLTWEILTKYELQRKRSKIEKIDKIGDWKCDDKIIYSVKSILDIDLNFQLIEHTIRSLFFIEENRILRNYNFIHLSGEEKFFDDKFRKKIIWFIESELVNLFHIADSQILSKPYFDFQEKYGNDDYYLEININAVSNQNKKGIHFEIIEKRIKEPSINREFNIIFEDRPNINKELYSIHYTSAYWEGTRINWEPIKTRILGHLEQFDKYYIKAIEQSMTFQGWINISIHAEHEGYVLNHKDEINQVLINTVGNRNYKVFIALSPQMGFDLREPEIFEI